MTKKKGKNDRLWIAGWVVLIFVAKVYEIHTLRGDRIPLTGVARRYALVRVWGSSALSAFMGWWYYHWHFVDQGFGMGDVGAVIFFGWLGWIGWAYRERLKAKREAKEDGRETES